MMSIPFAAIQYLRPNRGADPWNEALTPKAHGQRVASTSSALFRCAERIGPGPLFIDHLGYQVFGFIFLFVL
jgi:hypothetical protein